MDPARLYASPNALAPHYRRFDVSERILLSGHSHQAWPDCAEDGLREAFADAAICVDEKWSRAFAKAQRVREGFAAWLDDEPDRIALGASTHELVYRLLTALPLRERPRVLTTDSEFHSLRRQLDRLAEDGLEVVRLPSEPAGDVGVRLARALDADFAIVLVSAVFFESARIAGGLDVLASRARDLGVPLLVDAYHALGVMPYSLVEHGIEGAFVTGGGYKYLQLGEGNCFLRLPPGCALRPAFTGWFAEFGELTGGDRVHRVSYAPGPDRFAGATYNPSSHYRAARVFDFFDEQGLTPALLWEVSQHQLGVLAAAFDAAGLDEAVIRRDRSVPLEATGGFLSLLSPRAGELRRALVTSGVFCDHRGERLRLGPAPYVSDDQLAEAIDRLSEVVRLTGP